MHRPVEWGGREEFRAVLAGAPLLPAGERLPDSSALSVAAGATLRLAADHTVAAAQVNGSVLGASQRTVVPPLAPSTAPFQSRLQLPARAQAAESAAPQRIAATTMNGSLRDLFGRVMGRGTLGLRDGDEAPRPVGTLPPVVGAGTGIRRP